MALVAGLLVVLVSACTLAAGPGATIRRDGTKLSLLVPGYREANTHGYLCPGDPGSGPDRGEDGIRRLQRAGCLDLGVTEIMDATTAGWSAVVNLESLASAQLEAFSKSETFQIVLVSGDADGGRTWSTAVPAVDLVP